MKGKNRRFLRRFLMPALTVSFLLCGCAGVEPEKRAYPQVVAVDQRDGEYEMVLAMPNMQQATGQDKAGEETSGSVLSFKGKNIREIDGLYDRSQEKYLDLGHVRVLILGKEIIDSGLWEQAVCSMKRNPVIGEDIYVFQTEDVKAVMEYNGSKTDSLGDFLTGIYENRLDKGKNRGVTLRQVYALWYGTGELKTLPRLLVGEDTLQIVEPGEAVGE